MEFKNTDLHNNKKTHMMQVFFQGDRVSQFLPRAYGYLFSIHSLVIERCYWSQLVQCFDP